MTAYQDPSWGSMNLQEEHYRVAEEKKLNLKHYRTKAQIVAEYHCDMAQATAYVVGHRRGEFHTTPPHIIV